MTLVLDRSIPPALAPLHTRPLPAYRTAQLANGIPVHLVRFGLQPVVSLQLVFRAGHSYEPKPGVDGLMCRMLTEGTTHHTGLDIAQRFDEAGAFFGTAPGYEVTSLTLSSLARRLPEVLPLLQDIVLNATFPEAEWHLLRQRQQQQLAVEARKTSYHARRTFLQQVYGPQHPYAAHTGLDELAAVTRDDVLSYYRSVLRAGNCFILAAGQYDEDALLAELERWFGVLAPHKAEHHSRAAQVAPQPQQGLHYLPLPGNLQSAVRVGHGGMPRNHPDYHRMRLVTTILGGYFGSRLMQNIREDKGYTYGIGANWVSLRYGGYFGISTDVGNEYVQPTLAEIRMEMERLRQDPVPQAELDVARNYLLGRLIAEQETPFQIADILRALLAGDLPLDDHTTAFAQIQALAPADVLQLAQTYFKPEQLLQVVAGQM